MIKLRSFFVYWLPALVWMVIIYSASSDTQSAQHSSRIIAPIIRWLFPSLSENAVFQIVFIFRKLAHLTEYAILAFLIWWGLRKPHRKEPRPWRWRDAILAILIVAVYAASDEIHQLFVPHREGRFTDVLIDTTGAVFGMLGLWFAGKLAKAW